MIIVTKKFKGVEDGKIYPRWFDVGEMLSGDLAASALLQGVAENVKKKPPINKALNEAPKNKQSLSSPAVPRSLKKMLKKRKG